MDTIKFDKMEVKTDLAKAYFKKNNHQFPNNPDIRNTGFGKDGHGNTIFYHELPKQNIILEIPVEQNVVFAQNREPIRRLAEEVEKNTELFCQIEYLIRKIPTNEVKRYDIKLIVQNLLCVASDELLWENNYYDGTVCEVYMTGFEGVRMDARTPLANLALVAQLFVINGVVSIASCRDTAAVCNLFAELCRGVGLQVSLVFFDDAIGIPIELRFRAEMNTIPEINTGCIGVVAERSDMDSAIDTFLGATTNYPWKLSRILVQESVYENFKTALTWKPSLKKDKNDPAEKTLIDFCTDAFVYNGKSFLFDFVGNPETVGDKVLVESYRTTKEVISLVKKTSCFYLSLWANDVSQANEIAHAVPSSIVWINSYGVFDGPPRASEPIYKEIWLFPNREISNANLLKRQKEWCSRSFEDRRKIVQRVIDEFVQINKAKEQNIEKLRNALRNIKSDNFVIIDKDHMCIGLSIPLEETYITPNTKHQEMRLAKLLTNGSALIVDNQKEWVDKLLERLATDVPIFFRENPHDSVDAAINRCGFSRSKVIWTNFGTIFAN